MIRRTEITIETRRVLVIRRPAFKGWCERCLADVRMITPTEAATTARVSTRTIYRWVEEARLHFREEAGDALLVCADSLAACE